MRNMVVPSKSAGITITSSDRGIPLWVVLHPPGITCGDLQNPPKNQVQRRGRTLQRNRLRPTKSPRVAMILSDRGIPPGIALNPQGITWGTSKTPPKNQVQQRGTALTRNRSGPSKSPGVGTILVDRRIPQEIRPPSPEVHGVTLQKTKSNGGGRPLMRNRMVPRKLPRVAMISSTGESPYATNIIWGSWA
jgi:hypothetical protein